MAIGFQICAPQIYEQMKKKLPDRAEHQIARYKAEAAAGGIIRMRFIFIAVPRAVLIST